MFFRLPKFRKKIDPLIPCIANYNPETVDTSLPLFKHPKFRSQPLAVHETLLELESTKKTGKEFPNEKEMRNFPASQNIGEPFMMTNENPNTVQYPFKTEAFVHYSMKNHPTLGPFPVEWMTYVQVEETENRLIFVQKKSIYKKNSKLKYAFLTRGRRVSL